MYALRTSTPDVGRSDDVGSGLTATMRTITSQGFIQFHPSLAERLGFKAALFLGHALYWSRYLAKNQPKRNGWFFMTAKQWQQATGLTTREQTSVRELLVEQQLLVERVAGKPARLHFRVDLTQLAHWAGLYADEDGNNFITWEQFSPWMRGCVNFYRPLVDAAGGSVAAALYLSYLLHAQRQHTSNVEAQDGFFPVSQEDVRIALCLGPKTQRNARDKLKELGLLHERYGLARLDLDALGAALGQPTADMQMVRTRGPSVRHVIPAATKPDDASTTRALGRLGQPTRRQEAAAITRSAASRPQLLDDLVGKDVSRQLVTRTRRWLAPASGLAQTQQDGSVAPSGEGCQPSALLSKLGPKVAVLSNPTCPFVETNLPFCRTHIQKQSNTPTTTTRAGAGEPQPSFDKTASCRRRISESSLPSEGKQSAGEPDPQEVQQDNSAAEPTDALQLPMALPTEWHAAVRQTLLTAPQEVRQQLLDELEGQLGISGKTITNPPGYLHALIRKHAQGALVLALADQVAAARTQRARHQALLEQQAQQAPARIDPTPSTQPNDSEVARQSRERLKELRRQFVAGGGAA